MRIKRLNEMNNNSVEVRTMEGDRIMMDLSLIDRDMITKSKEGDYYITSLSKVELMKMQNGGSITKVPKMNSDPVNDVRKILQPLNKDFKVEVYSDQPLYVDQSKNTPDRKEFLVVTIALPDEIVNDEYSSIYFPMRDIFREVKNVISYCIKNNFKIRYMVGEFNRRIPQSEFDSNYHCDIHYKNKGQRGVSLDEDEKICTFEMSIDYL